MPIFLLGTAPHNKSLSPLKNRKLPLFQLLLFGLLMVLGDSVYAKGKKQLFFGFTQGYTSYKASDLNRAFELLEKQGNEFAGLNNYNIQKLDGHPVNAFQIGYQWNAFKVGFEYEYWSETFSQSQVPFDSTNRTTTITCEELRDPNFVLTPPSGCMDASEDFFFAPTLLYLSYNLAPNKFLQIGMGYGIGVLTGSSEIKISAEYLGADARPADEVSVELYPGIRMNQKLFVEFDLIPWKFLALNVKSGYRFLSFDEIEVRNMKGNSTVFDLLFRSPENGDKLYITRTAGGPESEELIMGSEADASLSPQYRLVGGQFSGLFISASIMVNWSFDDF